MIVDLLGVDGRGAGEKDQGFWRRLGNWGDG